MIKDHVCKMDRLKLDTFLRCDPSFSTSEIQVRKPAIILTVKLYIFNKTFHNLAYFFLKGFLSCSHL